METVSSPPSSPLGSSLPRKRRHKDVIVDFPCPYNECSNTYRNSKAVENHKKMFHCDIFHCPDPDCIMRGMNFQSGQNLLYHWSCDHSKIRLTFFCPDCHVPFLQFARRSEHMRKEHQVWIEKHRCKQRMFCDAPDCRATDKTFNCLADLCRHYDDVHSSLRFPCPECEFKLYSRAWMCKKHLREEHGWHIAAEKSGQKRRSEPSNAQPLFQSCASDDPQSSNSHTKPHFNLSVPTMDFLSSREKGEAWQSPNSSTLNPSSTTPQNLSQILPAHTSGEVSDDFFSETYLVGDRTGIAWEINQLCAFRYQPSASKTHKISKPWTVPDIPPPLYIPRTESSHTYSTEEAFKARTDTNYRVQPPCIGLPPLIEMPFNQDNERLAPEFERFAENASKLQQVFELEGQRAISNMYHIIGQTTEMRIVPDISPFRMSFDKSIDNLCNEFAGCFSFLEQRPSVADSFRPSSAYSERPDDQKTRRYRP